MQAKRNREICASSSPQLKPIYKAKNDIVEFMADYDVTPALKLTSQTGYNHDFLASKEDFNRFNSTSRLFFSSADQPNPGGLGTGVRRYTARPGGIMCDPQLGCSDICRRRSQSGTCLADQPGSSAGFQFQGPFNFSVGGNYLHYETMEDYYVFLNLLTLISRYQDAGARITRDQRTGLCLGRPQAQVYPAVSASHCAALNCPYTDPTPLTPDFNGQGHNYFRSINPYVLSSYAGFGEAYYQISRRSEAHRRPALDRRSKTFRRNSKRSS